MSNSAAGVPQNHTTVCGGCASARCRAKRTGRAPHEVPRTPMSDPIPPAAHENRPRAPAEMHGTADGGWDGDDGSVMSTRLGLGGVAKQTQR